MAIITKTPAVLDDREWDHLCGLFLEESDVLYALHFLRERKNLPQMALDLFPINESRPSAREHMNHMFRVQLEPYRITRIGSWAYPFNARRLAMVRWGVGTQISMPMQPKLDLVA